MAGIFFYLDTCFRQLHSHIAQIVVGIEIQERGYTMGIDHDVFRTAVGQCQGYGVDDAPFAGAHIEFFHIIDGDILDDVFHHIDKTVVWQMMPICGIED